MLANPTALEGNRGSSLASANDNVAEKTVIICDDQIDLKEDNCEPPSKKLKCKPSSSGSLNGHLVVIKDPFKSSADISKNNSNPSITTPKESQPTPKQSKVMEKQLLKEQREKERLLAQERKQQEKMAKQQEKEAKEMERLEKKALELKEKEERQKQRDEEKQKREMMQQMRDVEKKQKEELKRKKDEEREELKRKKEEERNQELEAKRQKMEEEEKKKNKARDTFKSFFIAKRPSPKSKKPVDSNALFQPFELKPGMSLAPCKRSNMKCSLDDYDKICRNQDNKLLYLKEHSKEWKKNQPLFVTRKSLRQTLELNRHREEDCVMVDNEDNDNVAINNEHQPKSMTAKLLQFHTNTRPAYYGTWHKKSTGITGRKPFHKDEDLLEYDFESDDEWEEEEPGESLSGPEDDEEEKNDPEDADGDEDGFFVPHGYLSDDEGLQSDDGEKETKSETEKCSYELDWDKKCKTLRPTFVFQYPTRTLKNDLPAILNNLKIEIIAEWPINIERAAKPNLTKKAVMTDGQETAVKSVKKQCYPVPDEAIPHLIRHVHNNRFGLNKLIVTFLKDWNNPDKFMDLKNREPISKRQLERKILSIAIREQTEQIKSGCYMVHADVLSKYHVDVSNIKQNDSL